MPAEAVPGLRVEVLYGAGPHVLDSTALVMPAGSQVIDAVRASGVLQRHGLAVSALLLGIWNRGATAETPVRDGDRVEIYRPLQVDPKEARRQRHARQMPPRRLRKAAPEAG
ncbi:MAG: RnfH family protein [Rubrivivax sp.]|nr:RnfH family protein [Rubrivivax sp.]